MLSDHIAQKLREIPTLGNISITFPSTAKSQLLKPPGTTLLPQTSELTMLMGSFLSGVLIFSSHRIVTEELISP